MDTEVLIVGAGPVGLILSIDLGKRGIRCILIEKNEAPLGYPKMERCNPRTMEIFRRLGLADIVRAAGYPPDWPMDIYFVFDLMRPPLFKMAHPTVAQAKARRDATIDGSLPLEPYQIISQYTLEPLLKSVAERTPNVTVKFAHELLSFLQESDGVVAQVRKTNGDTVPLRARHYHRIDNRWTLMIVQDSRKHFTLHAVVEKDEDMATLFERMVGTPVTYEMLYCAKWVQRLLLAEHYLQSRVFIAGDAAHLATSWPGSRLPHVWLEPGQISVHDRIADGFTLLRVGRNKVEVSGLQRSFSAIGAPFSALDVDCEAARRVYGFDYLLVRPDLHVVWRGDALPKDLDRLALVVTGH
jgi:FAD binding domain